MLRRSLLEISSRQTLRRSPRYVANQQIPSHLSSQKKLSTASKPDPAPAPGSTGKPPESSGSPSKFLIGTVALGAAFLAAYQTGYLDKYLKIEQLGAHEEAQINDTNGDSQNVQPSVDQFISPHRETSNNENLVSEHAEQKVDNHFPQLENAKEDKGDKPIQEQDKSDIAVDVTAPTKENLWPEHPQGNLTSDDQSKASVVQSEGSFGIRSTDTVTAPRLEQGIQHTSTSTQTSTALDENGMTNIQPKQQEVEERRENALDKDREHQPGLLEEYHLRNGRNHTYGHFSVEKEALNGATKGLQGGYISEDGKLILDFIQAIHAAEKRQADLDSHVFNEEKKVLKEKYEKKLKEAAARELMLAEEAALLDKELKICLWKLQEVETEIKLNKAQELSKAELNAAIAKEKAAQIERMAEANININALCMAFYARSEEARQSHAAQHFALGALALEDALSKGLPIQTEIASLQSSLEDTDKDSILNLVLSSLPEETRNNGTETPLQLKQKFDSLKGTLRHFSFFPPGGGGILAHSLAHMASWLKVKEADQSGEGIESVINKVENYLAEGKLVEAAELLEESVRGTQAAEVVEGWVRQARNRAISEQAVVFLQSYANSISFT
ncbi:uncharacterized protein LOC107633675 [Arachis ipaensis]|uniref:uncharacterized protein LOC107633675 n=1 Tax=Arachis ipaensis TaxID=130454 RepID=UPI000A2B3478|nr:uncharacterized protein LOC107633675 [Arachis ipaensis]